MGEMTLSHSLAEYRARGFVVAKGLFNDAEVGRIRHELARYLRAGTTGQVLEDDGVSQRAVHGIHLYDDFFACLTCDRRILGFAQTSLGSPAYVHQTKLNLKVAGSGDSWPWHQDFPFWYERDGIDEPRLVNVAVLLDNATMHNGPLGLIAGSHKLGIVTERAVEQGGWESDVSSQLTYQVGQRRADELIETLGIDYFTGCAGDVLFFDPLVVHGSAKNASSENRTKLIITYNSTENAPVADRCTGRPEFLCSPRHEALESQAEEWLLSR